MNGSSTALRVIAGAVGGAALCVVYFHGLDRWGFSTAAFAPIFTRLLAADGPTAWLALGVCASAALWRNPAPPLALASWLGRHPRAVAAVGVAAFAAGSFFVYHRHPLSMDEYAAVFQSQVFAAGRLVARLPPAGVDWLVVRGFNGAFLYASSVTGEAVEAYWPGFALLLAPLQFLGLPWLCNALLGGGALYLVFRITWEIGGDRTAAGWALLFTLASGAFAAYAMSYYAMQAHLTANLLFAYLLMRPTPARAFGAGLAGSLALVLHNPFPHALFAAPWLVSLSMNAAQRRRLVPLLAGYAPGFCVGVGWLLLRGNILPVAPTVAAVSGVGHGVFVWPDAALLQMRAASAVKLWLWSSPGLLPLAVLGWHGHRHDRRVRLLALSAALTFAGYCVVRLDQGHGWGYRYFHSAWGCLPVLAGLAFATRRQAAPRLAAFAGAAAVLSLVAIVPLQLHQIHGFIAQQLAQLPAPRRPGHNVWFVHPRAGFYLADMIQIDPLLRGPDLVLVSHGTQLDVEWVRRNRPDAELVAGGGWGQQWVSESAEKPVQDLTW